MDKELLKINLDLDTDDQESIQKLIQVPVEDDDTKEQIVNAFFFPQLESTFAQP